MTGASETVDSELAEVLSDELLQPASARATANTLATMNFFFMSPPVSDWLFTLNRSVVMNDLPQAKQTYETQTLQHVGNRSHILHRVEVHVIDTRLAIPANVRF